MKDFRVLGLVLPLVAAGLIGCQAGVGDGAGGWPERTKASSSSSAATSGVGGGGGGTSGASGCAAPPVHIPSPPAPSCLVGASCAYDADCPMGSHCNTALSPPACEKLYCGDEDSLCDADDLCQQSLHCKDGGHGKVCNACNVCGNRCAVDFDNDAFDCGCCNNRVPAGGVCKNGVPTCNNGVDCNGQCSNLAYDPNNCGACGQTCGVAVTGSMASCKMSGSTPHCLLERKELTTCNKVCSMSGLTCVGGSAAYSSWDGGGGGLDIGCASMPVQQENPGPNCSSPSSFCSFNWVTCQCNPLPKP